MKFSLLFSLSFLIFTATADLSPAAKKRCEEFTSIFENDTIELQYAYIENIGDGRGYTSGRAGFTTATGDAYEVVMKYTMIVPNNPLAKYLSQLKILADTSSGDVSNLDGYPEAWETAANDPVFRQCQDQVNDQLYYRPAMTLAAQVNVKTQLGMCEFYDCIIQHGGGDDPDSIGAIIARTIQAEGGPVTTHEKKWLLKFLEIRREDLVNPYDSGSQEEWSQSVDRVDAMVKLLKDGNLNLNGPICINTPDHTAIIP